MEFIHWFVNFVLHMDKQLPLIVEKYDTWVYLLFFLIIFCETGLVVTPFLPGDSLLFAAGTLAATGSLSIAVLLPVILAATFSGDNSNYFIGRFLGKRVYERDYKLIRKEYLIKTHNFYEKHGGKTVIIARFLPFIRTFAPFVAGAGTMKYARFIVFSIIGTTLWVSAFCSAGYFFGNIPFVQKHFSSIVVMLILIPGLPTVFAVVKQWLENRKKSEIQ
jgi:membrane-associated protein